MEATGLTAYPDLERELGRQIREAAIDHQSFNRRLKICELGQCRATCCHDGVILTNEEAGVIDGLLRQQRERLDGYGWQQSPWSTSEGGRVSSVTVEAGTLASDYPAHFPRTRCGFLDESHRCVLQRLAMDEDRHPWFWKPVSCWMHPLVLKPGRRGGRPELVLPAPGEDPAARSGYSGFASCTPCGMETEGGEPAWKVLAGELEALGRIGRRDLVGEIEAVLATK